MSATRTLSTAEDRREAVVEAAVRLFAERGIHATPTLEVARAAGISQAYLFRLFPTKEDLAIATVRRCNERIHATFVEAVREARAAGEPVIPAMGRAYVELLADRDLLVLQLHAHAASVSSPPIRDAMREGFRSFVALVERESDATPPEVQAFFAKGMLLNVLAALGAEEIDEPWARTLAAHPEPDC
jgi:AcrR family transcriptional regulator